MFTILKNPKTEIDWPVSVTLPADGGATTTQTFSARFRRLTDAQYERLAPSETAGTTLPLSEILARNAEFFAAVVSGWRDVRDEEHAEVPFSESLLRLFITGVDGPLVSAALFKAFGEMRSGARAKN